MNSLSFTSKPFSIGPIGNGRAIVPKSRGGIIATSTANQQLTAKPSTTTSHQCCTTVDATDGDDEKQKTTGIFRLTTRQHPPRYLSTSTMCRIKHGKNWRDAIAAIQDVQRQGYFPDAFMFCAVITKCGKQGQWIECLKLCLVLKYDFT